MFKSKRSAFVCIIFICFAVFYNCSESAVSSSYDDLVMLFNEFREYQVPPIKEGIPDYNPAAMEEKYAELAPGHPNVYDSMGDDIEKTEYLENEKFFAMNE